MVTLDSWTLDLVQVSSEESFTSYANLEMRLIIHKFSKFSETRVDLNNRYPQNLYRDDEVCFYINKFLLDCQTQILDKRLAGESAKVVADRNANVVESYMQRSSKAISVKRVGADKLAAKSKFSLDGAAE